MRRSLRLAEIVDILRDGRLHRAGDIAAALAVSVRTVYRDMDTLVASGVPVDGERGVGYLLREPVFLPPMTLSVVELEALHLGMAIVTEAADPELQTAARTLLAKVTETVSNRRKIPESWGFEVYPMVQAQPGFRHMPVLRAAIRDRAVLEIDYLALDARHSTRRIRPLQTEYWGRVWTCTAWCEARQKFRAFRIDRITRCEVTGQRFGAEPGRTLADFLRQMAGKDRPDAVETDGENADN